MLIVSIIRISVNMDNQSVVNCLGDIRVAASMLSNALNRFILEILS